VTQAVDGDETAEVAAGEQDWAYVRPLPGHAIINLGDALVMFTKGVLRSNVHRVVAPPGRQAEVTRFSLVYFSRPEDDVVLKPLRESALIRERCEDMVEEEEVDSKTWILRRAFGRRIGGKWEITVGTEDARGARG
jgi:isopenicillin N synthase-like dioxygenase